jgi:hypothetical protein
MPGIDTFTKLCAHLDGADGSTTFTDSSAGAHTITAHGNVQIDTAQSVFGGASVLYDGSGDWLSADGHSDFALGTGDFVVDFWIRPDNTGLGIWADFSGDHDGAGSLLVFQNGGSIFFYHAGVRITGSHAEDVWQHFALVRSSGVTRMFIDGVQTGADYSDTNTYTVDANCPTFGAHADGSGSFPFAGWMDEIRISKGTDRGWFGGFTPPTAAYSAAVPRSFAAVMG